MGLFRLSLEKENERLRRAVSDLTLDKQILTEAARGNIFSSLFGALGSMLLSAPFDPVQRPRGSRFSPRST